MKTLLCLAGLLMFNFYTPMQAQCISGNCKNGKGTYQYESGAKYTGEFHNGKIEGKGSLYFSNGNVYTGDWVNMYREGKGKMKYASGEVYTGEFKKSKCSGEGTITYTNGDRYAGSWDADAPNGTGTYYYSDGDRYVGNFVNGKYDGEGTMFYKNGATYSGHWKNNQKDGQGLFVKTDGTKIAGLWDNGVLMSSEPPVKPSRTTPPTLDPSKTKEKYRDCNTENCESGTGMYVYSDGSKYIGEFSQGDPEGQGTCYYANGDKYVGGFSHNAPHGEGVMYFASGRVYGAVWNYGKPAGQIKPSEKPAAAEPRVTPDNDPEVKIWAVVVGIGRYVHMPTLKFSDDDAYQMYAFLKSPEGGALPDNQVRVLIDEDATRENILKAMREVFLKADENDVVMFYYSGHGVEGAFLPDDFDGFNNQLEHEEIKKILLQSKAKQKICIADACHSGTLLAMKDSYAGTLQRYYQAFDDTKGGLALLMSSKAEEYSLEDNGLRSGVFSHFLIQGLKGGADTDKNKIISIKELFDFVYQKVRNYTANAQSPVLTGKFDNNMPVAVRR